MDAETARNEFRASAMSHLDKARFALVMKRLGYSVDEIRREIAGALPNWRMPDLPNPDL
ncbi:MAG: hypothetical protein K2Y71_29265 [Xanthobacteraceae bacterium]|nr:hypothetical protein [Xanthobacteraceae bacterium]